MQQRLIDLAIQARGKKSRPEALSLMDELSLNSYYNFENGKVWPQSANLRKIEEALSLTPGIMTELAGSADSHPGSLERRTPPCTACVVRVHRRGTAAGVDLPFP